MSLFKDKCRLIRQILRSKNSMVITFDKDIVGFDYAGNSIMFGQLFHSAVQHVSDWVANWHRINSINKNE